MKSAGGQIRGLENPCDSEFKFRLQTTEWSLTLTHNSFMWYSMIIVIIIVRLSMESGIHSSSSHDKAHIAVDKIRHHHHHLSPNPAIHQQIQDSSSLIHSLI